MTDSALLSRLLFEAREVVAMYADVVKSVVGTEDQWLHRLVAEIDTYRVGRGWDGEGFGREDE